MDFIIIFICILWEFHNSKQFSLLYRCGDSPSRANYTSTYNYPLWGVGTLTSISPLGWVTGTTCISLCRSPCRTYWIPWFSRTQGASRDTSLYTPHQGIEVRGKYQNFRIFGKNNIFRHMVVGRPGIRSKAFVRIWEHFWLQAKLILITLKF